MRTRYRIFRDGEWKDWMEPSDFSPSPPSPGGLVYYEESEPIDMEWWRKVLGMMSETGTDGSAKLAISAEHLRNRLRKKPEKFTPNSDWIARKRQSIDAKKRAMDKWCSREQLDKKRR